MSARDIRRAESSSESLDQRKKESDSRGSCARAEEPGRDSPAPDSVKVHDIMNLDKPKEELK